MKQVTFFLFILMSLTFTKKVSAQSSQIVCSAYKQVFKVNGKWGKWPNHWTTYTSEGRAKPVIRITTIGGGIYRLQMFKDGIVKADFYVRYDSELTAKKRVDWNTEYINCYKDTNGDYVYTEDVSLQSLAEDPSSWRTNSNSQLYMWIDSEGMALVVK